MADWKKFRHTALKSGAVMDSSPCDRFEENGITAFRWDVFAGWSPEHLKGDALFMEIPWRRGFQVFEERAGFKKQEDRTHRAFVEKVMEMLSGWDSTAVLFHGKEIHKLISGQDSQFESTLFGGQTLVSVFNCKDMPEFKSDWEIYDWVADRSEVLVNPVCGYGRTARIAKNKGKRAVVSDYNSTCIGYIRDHWSSW